MRRVVLHPEAAGELLREVAYYAKGHAGSDRRFLNAVEAAVARASQNPLSGAATFGETRSIRIKGFPFSVVYQHDMDVLKVIAISPHRRRPLYWLDRQG